MSYPPKMDGRLIDTCGEGDARRVATAETSAKVRRHHPGQNVLPDSVPKTTWTTAIDLDITDGCNLACTYCFKNLDKPHNMSLETAKDAIEWLIRASGDSERISVNFMGGEPTLMFSRLKEIVRWGKRRAHAAGKRVFFSMTSNMTLWTDEIREWVDREGMGVLMSVDGLPEMQDAQRPSKDGKPKAQIVAKWAKSMLRTRPRSDGRLTISPQWVHRVFDTCVYMWDELGFTNIVAADCAYEDWTSGHIAMYREQMSRCAGYIYENFLKDRHIYICLFSILAEKLIVPRSKGEKPARRNSPCGAGYNYSMIDYQGNIWPCHRFDSAAEDSGTGHSMKMGNIYGEAYNEQLSNAFRNFDHSTIYKEACKTCPFEPICGGSCPAANLQHSRENIYKPHDAYCELKRIMYDIADGLHRRLKDADPDRCAAYYAAASKTSETA